MVSYFCLLSERLNGVLIIFLNNLFKYKLKYSFKVVKKYIPVDIIDNNILFILKFYLYLAKNKG
jgi:hypothetical protein